jgi:hypothetical protein
MIKPHHNHMTQAQLLYSEHHKVLKFQSLRPRAAYAERHKGVENSGRAAERSAAPSL